MIEKLGVLLVEQEDGNVSVQMFAQPEGAKENFRQLTCRPGQKPFRATFIDLDWQGGVVKAETRSFPEEEESADDRPDGWRLGEGPIFFPKKFGKPEVPGDIGVDGAPSKKE